MPRPRKYFSAKEKKEAINKKRNQRNLTKILEKARKTNKYFNTKTNRLNKYSSNAQKQRSYRERKKNSEKYLN